MNYNTIDDEFASLFLKELQKSTLDDREDNFLNESTCADSNKFENGSDSSGPDDNSIADESSNFNKIIQNIHTETEPGTLIQVNEVFNQPYITNQAEKPLEGIKGDSLQQSYVQLVVSPLEVLSFKPFDSSNFRIVSGSDKDLNFKIQGRLDGKFFIDQDTNKFIQHSTNISGESIDLLCYRRNNISVILDISMESALTDYKKFYVLSSDGNKQEFKKIKLELNNKLLIKGKSDNEHNLVTVDDNISICGSDNSTGNESDEILYLNSTHEEFDLETLANKKSACWDQLKFTSATGNNRHDNDKKSYVLQVKIKFADSFDRTVSEMLLRSNKIRVRGRNPNFFSKNGDVLVRDTAAGNALHRKRGSTSSQKRQFKKNKTSPKKENSSSNDNQHGILEDKKPVSTYEYFKVDKNYYLPPVDVGYFPHHVHHNKQVFKTASPIENDSSSLKFYNYFM